MGLKSFTEDLLWVILFALFIISFAIFFLGTTNPNSEAMTDDAYGLNTTATSLNNWVNDFNTFSNETKTRLSGSTPNTNILISVFLIFEGAFSIPWNFLVVMSSGLVTIGNTIFKLGGGGTGGLFTIIASVVLALLLIRLVLAIVETIRTGNSGK